MALKAIYSARDGMQAHLLRSLLVAEGIPATVMGEWLAPATGGIPLGAETAPAVWVHEENVARAKAVVARFDEEAARKLPLAVDAPWRCPSCGETIEGQFTECWSCLKSRPADGASGEMVEAGPADLTLGADLLCVQCEYNLRGLTPRHRCPECGLPILRSLLDVLREDVSPDPDELERVLRQLFVAVAPAIGYAASALILVCHAWMSVAYTVEASEEKALPTATAGRVCLAVRDAAIDPFGGLAEAKLGLRAWGIKGSDDIGRIVKGLMDAGIIEESQRELGNGYEGLFNLDGLFLRVE